MPSRPDAAKPWQRPVRRKRQPPFAPDPLAWVKVADLTAPEGFAIKAIAAGTATPEQQRRAFDFILRRACRIEELDFVLDAHGGDRASAFAAGRRSVGIALREIAALPDSALHSDKDAQQENP